MPDAEQRRDDPRSGTLPSPGFRLDRWLGHGGMGAPAGRRRAGLLAGVLLLALIAAVKALWPATKPTHVVTPAPPPLAAAPVATEPPLRSVHIVSSPEHASVSLDGVALGTTPYDLPYRRPTEVALDAPGYRTQLLQLTLATEPSVAVELLKISATQTIPAELARPLPRPALTRPTPLRQLTPPPPAPLRALDARSLPSRERRQALLASGPPYRTVEAAKRAYRERRIDEAYYDDIAWALKARRHQRIALEKQNYRQRVITRDEYARRVKRIDDEYAGN